jgi:NADH dehydrogenase
MSEAVSRAVEKRLRHLGVSVHTGRQVQSASASDLVVSGKPIESHTVIWTSGVANNPFYNANQKHFTFAPNGRIVVDKYLQATDNVYVIGDNAATPYTGFAQTALHDAIFVARNLQRRSNHQKQKVYTASMPAVVVPVGENWAIAEWKGIRLSGWLGSCVRRAADFLGYSDVLPIGQALGVWRTSKVMEDDYFEAESSFDDPHAKR